MDQPRLDSLNYKDVEPLKIVFVFVLGLPWWRSG